MINLLQSLPFWAGPAACVAVGLSPLAALAVRPPRQPQPGSRHHAVHHVGRRK